MRGCRDARGRTVNLTRLTTYVSESKIDTQVVKKLNFALGNRILEKGTEFWKKEPNFGIRNRTLK